MSLAGKTIVVTRDSVQAKPFINQLKKLGAKIFLFPTIKIIDSNNNDAIHKVIKDIDKYDWILFSSTNAVKYFFKYVNSSNKVFQKIMIACVGNKSAEVLTTFNLKPLLIPMSYSAYGLIEVMNKIEIKGKQILLPGSNIARPELQKELQARGAVVSQIEVYKNIPNDDVPKKELIQYINDSWIDCITFFSPSAVNSFIEIVGKKIIETIRSKQIPIAVIGPSTEQAVRKKNLIPVIQPANSDSDLLIESMQKYFSDQ